MQHAAVSKLNKRSGRLLGEIRYLFFGWEIGHSLITYSSDGITVAVDTMWRNLQWWNRCRRWYDVEKPTVMESLSPLIRCGETYSDGIAVAVDTMWRNLQWWNHCRRWYDVEKPTVMESLSPLIRWHSTKFCVKEMKEKSVTFCFLKSKAKKKTNFLKSFGAGWLFSGEFRSFLSKLMFTHSVSC